MNINNKILIITLFLFLINISASKTQNTVLYNLSISKKDVLMNLTIKMYSEEPTDIWKLSWNLPSNSEVFKINDEKEIEDYRISNNDLTFETNPDENRTSEKVDIKLKIDKVVNDKYSPLKIFNISLPSFSEANTHVVIKVPELISETHSFGFDSYFKENKFKLEGKGPVNFRILYGKGNKYGCYVIFAEKNITKANELNPIISKVTGITIPFDRFPIIVLGNEEYEKTYDKWGNGAYKGGLIALKNSSIEKEEITGIILHETTHGYNDYLLNWNKANYKWYDEGVAKYIEFLTNKLLDVKQSEIFGNEITYEKDSTRYTLPSRSDSEELWEYYINNKTFMRYWDPNEGKRDFGYAFSELLIRYLIYKKDPTALQEVSQELLEINHTVDNIEESNKILLNALDSNMRPCYFKDKAKFEQCLEEINDMDANIPEFERKIETIKIKEKLGVKTQKTNKTLKEIKEQGENKKGVIANIFYKIKRFLSFFFRFLFLFIFFKTFFQCFHS